MRPTATATFGPGVTVALSLLLYAGVYGLEQRLAFTPPSWITTALFALATAGQFACYGRALQLSRGDRPAWRRRLIAGALLAWIGLALTPPVLSMDVFSYLAHGHQLNDGVNPYIVETREVGREAYGDSLRAWGWLPVHDASPYGPLWTRFESWSFPPGAGVYAQMLSMKLPVVAGGLVAAAFIWLTLGRLAPAWQAFGTILFLWNPLVVHELAGGGHNDAMMLAFCTGGLYLFARQRPALGTAAICGAALVKLTALMVAPPLAVHVLRDGGAPPGRHPGAGDAAGRIRLARTRLARVAACAAVVGAIAFAGWWLYGDLWMGRATFAGLRLHAEPNITPSTGGTLFYYLTRSHSESGSARAVSLLLNGMLGIATIAISLTATNLPRTFTACAALSLAVLLLATSYWPWYAVTPVALWALAPASRMALPVVMAFSLGGRLAAPLDRLRLNGLMDWPTEAVVTTVVGLWLPLAIAALVVASRLPRRRALRLTALSPLPR